MNEYPLLARFNQWANARLYDSVAQLPPARYFDDQGAFFGSIHRTLNHLLVVDRLWTGRIQGIDRGIRALDQVLCEDLAALRVAREQEDRRLVALVATLGEEDLGRPVRYRRIIGNGFEELSVRHILMTLFNHQTHHRGQVHTLLTQAWITPRPLDVVFFLDEIGECREVEAA
jgi:uncharacterized damage-inducible protein DinB